MQVQEMDDNPEGEANQSHPGFWTVAIYLTDRAYGGPEEGGWWYDCGQRVDNPHEFSWIEDGGKVWFSVPAIFTDEDAAIEYTRRINEGWLTIANADRRSDVGSVLSEGRYAAEVWDGYPPTHYPDVKPHYE